jgi:hypothetical protein
MMQTKRRRERRSLCVQFEWAEGLAAARDALISRGLLKEDQRQDDPKALQKAVVDLLYRAEQDLP